jgi:hypothetical protein
MNINFNPKLTVLICLLLMLISNYICTCTSDYEGKRMEPMGNLLAVYIQYYTYCNLHTKLYGFNISIQWDYGHNPYHSYLIIQFLIPHVQNLRQIDQLFHNNNGFFRMYLLIYNVHDNNILSAILVHMSW